MSGRASASGSWRAPRDRPVRGRGLAHPEGRLAFLGQRGDHAIRDDDGTLVGFAKVTRDLSERKRHEEERIALARAEEARRAPEENEERARSPGRRPAYRARQAEEATRLKDEFLATVGHELRTPLNAILGWAACCRAACWTRPKSPRAVDAIVRNAVAQNQIVDDLLDVSRIVAGQLRLDIDFVDISPVVNAAVDGIRAAAEAKSVAVQVVVNPEAGVIKGDAGRLQQVLWNLLNNAVKFTPRGGRIYVTLRRVDSSIEIEVADNGKGIAPNFCRGFSSASASRRRATREGRADSGSAWRSSSISSSCTAGPWKPTVTARARRDLHREASPGSGARLAAAPRVPRPAAARSAFSRPSSRGLRCWSSTTSPTLASWCERFSSAEERRSWRCRSAAEALEMIRLKSPT